MPGSFTYTIAVRRDDLSRESRVLNILWHKGEGVPSYSEDQGFGDRLTVYFGDGYSRTITLSSLTKEGSANEGVLDIDFSYKYYTVRYWYHTEREYEVRIEWDGDKCPEFSFKDTIVDRVETQLPMMFSDTGRPVTTSLSFFHGSNIRRVGPGVFKNWGYMREIKWMFRDAHRLEYVDSELFNDMPQLRVLIGIFRNIGAWSPMLRFRGKNLTTVQWLFERTIPPLGVVYAIKDSTTYNEIKEPTNRNLTDVDVRLLAFQRLPKEDMFEKPDGYFIKDGRRFDAVFYHRVPGVQTFGMLNITGIDLGQIYTQGVSTIQTGYIDSTGVDVGEKLLADVNVRFIPIRPGYSLSDKKGRGRRLVFKYRCLGNWSHNFNNLVSSIPNIVKVKNASYIKETKTLAVAVEVVVTGNVTKPFVFGLTDEYAGLMFTSEPMMITTVQTREINRDCSCSDHCGDSDCSFDCGCSDSDCECSCDEDAFGSDTCGDNCDNCDVCDSCGDGCDSCGDNCDVCDGGSG